MTTLIVIDGHRPGNRRMEVAARLRAELARLNITDTEAARRCGKTQAWLSRRTNGKVAFDVDDLDMVCEILGISYDFVATGIRELPTPTPPPTRTKTTDKSRAVTTPHRFGRPSAA